MSISVITILCRWATHTEAPQGALITKGNKLKTITLTTYYTKKRVNSKKWDYYREEWQDVNGSRPGKVQLNHRALVVTTKFYNVPDTMNTEELCQLWQCVIVSTPFGMPIFEHDYNDIIDQKIQGGISYTIVKNINDYKTA
jgi:hypothetical protein